MGGLRQVVGRWLVIAVLILSKSEAQEAEEAEVGSADVTQKPATTELIPVTTTEPVTTTLMITTPIKRTVLFGNNGTSTFAGWPLRFTDAVATELITYRTDPPINTIPCPKCRQEKDGEEICQLDDWCNLYEGCWYFMDTQGTLTKGCIDIIPEDSGFKPYECNDLYKDKVCFKETCLSCDVYGTGEAAERKALNKWLAMLCAAAAVVVVL